MWVQETKYELCEIWEDDVEHLWHALLKPSKRQRRKLVLICLETRFSQPCQP